jgi:cyclic dehypoxanthinyl futalosine synthase
MEIAQSIGLITTSSMVIGFGETIDNRLNHFQRLRDAQDRSIKRGHKGFNAFISWTLQLSEDTSMGRSRKAGDYGASSIDYLRNVAIARIFLDNIPHHQSSWPTLGPDVAMMGLHFGCNDIGSTMMEENVVSSAGALTKNKWSMSPEELRSYIRKAGFIPAERDSYFKIIKSFDR